MKKRRIWTEQEIAMLRDLYPDTQTTKLAELFGCEVKDIYNCADRYELRKSEAYLAGPFSARLKNGEAGKNTRFKPGNVSWNKGMKGVSCGGEKTRFKPGNRSGNALEKYQPIGAERITQEGYLQRKVNDDMPFHKRWRMVHVMEWEAVNGPVPPGMVVVFRNGNRKDIRLENLELVTRRQLILRNTVERYGKEVKQMIQLRSALNRRINNMTREKQA